MTGEQQIPASQQDTWRALNDPEVLRACVPGCESITKVNENEYQVQMTAKVGPVSAKFRGRLSLFDIKPPQSYSLAFEGQGGPAGFAKGAAQVKLSSVSPHETKLSYEVKASVGGTASTSVGFSGRSPWSRCNAYRANTDTALNASNDTA